MITDRHTGQNIRTREEKNTLVNNSEYFTTMIQLTVCFPKTKQKQITRDREREREKERSRERELEKTNPNAGSLLAKQIVQCYTHTLR